MGGKSTLHSAVLRHGGPHENSSFDLRSWQGLTYVLRAGKEALKEKGAYAEFRNLVLQYAQNGGDADTKKQIDAIIKTFPPIDFSKKVQQEQGVNEKSDAEEVVATDTPQANIRPHTGRRVEPRFGTQRSPVVKAHVEAPAEKQEVEHVTTTPVTDTEHKVEEVREVVSIPPAQEVSSEPITPAHTTVEVVHRSLEEHRIRITEIKRAVNEYIGNPVALMSLSDDVGKKYMSALLGALKSTSAGGDGNADGAMATLESAYGLLVATSKSKDEKEVKIISSNDTDAHSESTPVKETDAPPQEVIEDKQETVSIPVSDSIPNISLDVQETNKAPDVPVEEIKDVAVVKEAVHAQPTRHDILRSGFKKSDNAISSVVRSVQQKKYVERESSAPLVVETADIPKIEEMISPDINPQPRRKIISEDEKKVIEKVAVKQSELYSTEITTMLETLLHEWSVFSGSGIFGTGPGGTLHPLFKTLSQLSMGEVVAGRFEGSDPKILKIIKQYIDAWRHEQGITYTLNETFEHYLRRVVQRILKRQNG